MWVCSRVMVRSLSLTLALALGLTACSGEGESSARVLDARETFEVSAVSAVATDGYAIASAVCEVTSSESYRPGDGVFGGKLVFHAFRVGGPGINGDTVVLFASNHAAADGSGLVIPVNAAAVNLDQGFPPGSNLADPVTEDMNGASAAVACAQDADEPPEIDLGEFNVEAWRAEAIERFGPEEVFDDGSKDDHVKLAFLICDQSAGARNEMKGNLGADYAGSFQEFIITEFCPNV